MVGPTQAAAFAQRRRRFPSVRTRGGPVGHQQHGPVAGQHHLLIVECSVPTRGGDSRLPAPRWTSMAVHKLKKPWALLDQLSTARFRLGGAVNV